MIGFYCARMISHDTWVGASACVESHRMNTTRISAATCSVIVPAIWLIAGVIITRTRKPIRRIEI